MYCVYGMYVCSLGAAQYHSELLMSCGTSSALMLHYSQTPHTHCTHIRRATCTSTHLRIHKKGKLLIGLNAQKWDYSSLIWIGDIGSISKCILNRIITLRTRRDRMSLETDGSFPARRLSIFFFYIFLKVVFKCSYSHYIKASVKHRTSRPPLHCWALSYCGGHQRGPNIGK